MSYESFMIFLNILQEILFFFVVASQEKFPRPCLCPGLFSHLEKVMLGSLLDIHFLFFKALNV